MHFNPIYFIDPDGMQGEDWFKNGSGRVVWFDNKSESFTDSDGQKWSNVGANTQEVKENLNVPEDKKYHILIGI